MEEASVDKEIILEARPHHLLCVPFTKVDPEGRGDKFDEINSFYKKTILETPTGFIRIIEGVDRLCGECPHRRGDRCESPDGNEEEVRKLDGIVLKGLGLQVGDVLSLEDLRSTLRAKAPISFCRKCPWQDYCTLGSGEKPRI